MKLSKFFFWFSDDEFERELGVFYGGYVDLLDHPDDREILIACRFFGNYADKTVVNAEFPDTFDEYMKQLDVPGYYVDEMLTQTTVIRRS